MIITRAILIGIIIWVLGVSVYMISFYLPLLEDKELQANIILFMTVIPLVWYGSAFYYKKEKDIHGFRIGLIFLAVSVVLDALITVPVFMKPNGVTHLMFFTDLGFWGVALVFQIVVVFYYHLRVLKQFVKLKK